MTQPREPFTLAFEPLLTICFIMIDLSSKLHDGLKLFDP